MLIYLVIKKQLMNMKNLFNKKWWEVAGLIFLILFSNLFLTNLHSEMPLKELTFFEKLEQANYKFIDEKGVPIDFKSYSSKRIVLTMSYTNCKKLCPLKTIKKLLTITQTLQAQLCLMARNIGLAHG